MAYKTGSRCQKNGRHWKVYVKKKKQTQTNKKKAQLHAHLFIDQCHKRQGHLLFL